MSVHLYLDTANFYETYLHPFLDMSYAIDISGVVEK